jgi:hypothetical protein
MGVGLSPWCDGILPGRGSSNQGFGYRGTVRAFRHRVAGMPFIHPERNRVESAACECYKHGGDHSATTWPTGLINPFQMPYPLWLGRSARRCTYQAR